jgi:ribosomal protein S18 acetylase RimI-like enzyme
MANAPDDKAIVRLCLALNAEDPGPNPVPAEHMQRTLEVLRKEPHRGCATVLEIKGRTCGYALLMAFWSNELGGEICTIDELYVEPEHRGRRHATRLIDDLAAGKGPYTPRIVALTLETTPNNIRARRLYERLGFRAGGPVMRRLVRLG